MKEKIEQLRKEVEQYVIGSADQLEQFRLNYLSKKGLIPSLFEGFREVPPEQKKEIGLLLNELKQLASDIYSEFKEGLSDSESSSAEADLTRPAAPFARGSRHPISIVRTEII
ncbi:MAG: phenylalanine--tRNA ligase subunit alpha, partial [Bacteroidales bacterium]|nr:phenylalanine--tRNA ligase subunit alpha [Bacteroidales bacterium]